MIRVMIIAMPVLFLVAMGISLLQDHAHAKRLARLHNLLSDSSVQSGKNGMPSANARPDSRLPAFLRQLLYLAGVNFAPFQIAAAATLTLLAGGITWLILGPAIALAGVSLLAISGYGALRILAMRRMAKFATYLPGFLDRMRQLIVIGNSLPIAFTRAIAGSQPIVVEFLNPVVRRISNGAAFSDSIRQCANDLDLHEMRLLATTIAANARFGGSISRALENLIAYMRKRAAIVRELRASTTQIRVSAWVLGLLPIVVGGAIMAQNQDYAAWFIEHSAGRKMLAYCILSQVSGAILMRAVARTRF